MSRRIVINDLSFLAKMDNSFRFVNPSEPNGTFTFSPKTDDGNFSFDKGTSIYTFDVVCPQLHSFDHWLKPWNPKLDPSIVANLFAENRILYRFSIHSRHFSDGIDGILGKNPMLYVKHMNPWNLATWDLAYPINLLTEMKE